MLYVKYRWEIWKRWWQHVLLRTNNNNMTFDFTWLVLTGFFCTISKQVKVFMSNLIFKGLKTPSEGRSGRFWSLSFQSTCLWTERRPLCPPVNVSAHTDPPRFQKPTAYSHVVTPSTDLILALLLLLLMMFGLTVWGQQGQQGQQQPFVGTFSGATRFMLYRSYCLCGVCVACDYNQCTPCSNKNQLDI